MKLKRQHSLLSYLKTLCVGPVGVSDSRSPASQAGAQPSELPVPDLVLIFMLICRAESRIAKTQIKPFLQNSKTARIKVQKHVLKVDYRSHQSFMYTW